MDRSVPDQSVSHICKIAVDFTQVFNAQRSVFELAYWCIRIESCQCELHPRKQNTSRRTTTVTPQLRISILEA